MNASGTVPATQPGASPRTPALAGGQGSAVGGDLARDAAGERQARSPSGAATADPRPTGYCARGASRVRFAERDASGTVRDRNARARKDRLAGSRAFMRRPRP